MLSLITAGSASCTPHVNGLLVLSPRASVSSIEFVKRIRTNAGDRGVETAIRILSDSGETIALIATDLNGRFSLHSSMSSLKQRVRIRIDYPGWQVLDEFLPTDPVKSRSVLIRLAPITAP